METNGVKRLGRELRRSRRQTSRSQHVEAAEEAGCKVVLGQARGCEGVVGQWDARQLGLGAEGAHESGGSIHGWRDPHAFRCRSDRLLDGTGGRPGPAAAERARL
jgi:hypothetical protein